jgi:hypothetical protein
VAPIEQDPELKDCHENCRIILPKFLGKSVGHRIFGEGHFSLRSGSGSKSSHLLILPNLHGSGQCFFARLPEEYIKNGPENICIMQF